MVIAGIFYGIVGIGGALWMRGSGYLPWPAGGLALGAFASACGIGAAIGVGRHLAYRPLHGRTSVGALERASEEAVAVIGLRNLFAILPGAVLAEEVFFRGAMQQAFGLVVASIAFGLAHFMPPRREFWVYPVLSAAAGFALGFSFWVTDGHLMAPFTAHLVVNALNLGMLRGKLEAAARRIREQTQEQTEGDGEAPPRRD